VRIEWRFAVVKEVQRLLLPGGVGDLLEAVGLIRGEDLGQGGPDQDRGDQRELGGEVLGEDLLDGLPVRPVDADLHVESARPAKAPPRTLTLVDQSYKGRYSPPRWT
jgi:hypothetical protein